MLLIKLVLSLVYYGILAYTFRKLADFHQEYLVIKDEYTQAREQIFPNLTKQEQKKRQKAMGNYYEKKNPSFALKRKLSYIPLVICFIFIIRIIPYLTGDVLKHWNDILFHFGMVFILFSAIVFYLYKSKENERETFQQYLMEHPKNELQVVLVPESLQTRFMKNINKMLITSLLFGIELVLHTVFSNYVF